MIKYNTQYGFKEGLKAATGVGTTSSVTEKVLTRRWKWTPVGAFSAYFGKRWDKYKDMQERMNYHDKTVDHHRNKEKK